MWFKMQYSIQMAQKVTPNFFHSLWQTSLHETHDQKIVNTYSHYEQIEFLALVCIV